MLRGGGILGILGILGVRDGGCSSGGGEDVRGWRDRV